jgi:hypothetical protein
MAATKKQSLLNVWVSSGHKECSGRNQMIQEINFAAASFCVRCSRVSGTPAAKTEPHAAFKRFSLRINDAFPVINLVFLALRMAAPWGTGPAMWNSGYSLVDHECLPSIRGTPCAHHGNSGSFQVKFFDEALIGMDGFIFWGLQGFPDTNGVVLDCQVGHGVPRHSFQNFILLAFWLNVMVTWGEPFFLNIQKVKMLVCNIFNL